MLDTRLHVACMVLAIAFAAPASAQGYQVQPMLGFMEPSGPKASQRLSIRNTGSASITLELEPFRVTHDDQGHPTRAAEDKDFVAFPPQTVIPPGKEQQVQVRYIGDARIPEARIYGIKVAQVPVDFTGETASSSAKADVKLSFNFLSHFVVSPAGASSRTIVDRVAAAPDGGLTLTVRNDGNAVLLLNDMRLQAMGADGRTIDLPADAADVGDLRALLPNRERTIRIPAKSVAGLAPPIKLSLQAP